MEIDMLYNWVALGITFKYIIKVFIYNEIQCLNQ